jgi:hypothetical protein
MFKKAGRSMEDAANKIAISAHRGPHPQADHEAVFQRLGNATEGISGGAYSAAFRSKLGSIRSEASTAGATLNKLLTGNDAILRTTG